MSCRRRLPSPTKGEYTTEARRTRSNRIMGKRNRENTKRRKREERESKRKTAVGCLYVYLYSSFSCFRDLLPTIAFLRVLRVSVVYFLLRVAATEDLLL